MKFKESIGHGFNNYAEFEGRETLSTFWWWILFVTLVSAVLETKEGLIIFQDLWSIAILLPNISSAVRRLHDVNRSGWYLLIPIYNVILLCQRGTVGENRFGSAPLS